MKRQLLLIIVCSLSFSGFIATVNSSTEMISDVNHYSGTYTDVKYTGINNVYAYIQFNFSYSQQNDDCSSIQDFQYSMINFQSATPGYYVQLHATHFSYTHNDLAIYGSVSPINGDWWLNFPMTIHINEMAMFANAPVLCE